MFLELFECCRVTLSMRKLFPDNYIVLYSYRETHPPCNRYRMIITIPLAAFMVGQHNISYEMALYSDI